MFDHPRCALVAPTDVRWLSYFNAFESFISCYEALIVAFEGEWVERKDDKAKGASLMLRCCCNTVVCRLSDEIAGF